MKVGVHGIALALPIGKGTTIEETFETMKKADIKCLTIPIQSPVWNINPINITKNEITIIKEKIPSNIEITGLGYSWPNEYTIITDSTKEFKRNLDYANKLSETASILGANHVVVGSGGRSVPQGYPYYKGVKKLISFWKEACIVAEEYGVVYCIEQSPYSSTNVGNTIKSVCDIVEAVDSPSFQMIAQIKDMAVNDLDVSDSIMAGGDRIKQVHIGDISGYSPLTETGGSLLLPGKGVLSFIDIFRALKEIGYNGELSVEAFLSDDPVSDLVWCREFIELTWRQA